MSLYGLAFACPVCPSTHAFGFSRLTLWILAQRTDRSALSIRLLSPRPASSDLSDGSDPLHPSNTFAANDLGAQTDQTVGAQKATNPKKEEKRK
ncbi:MAG: hypothetical protein D6724_02025 [Armatimonadetes bacterium]|nr:MAG: hypothetical protein D6724_02025 [Armatimonadota bacterium]